MGKQNFVIVGASLAGAKAAEELRQQGFDGSIVMIGAESERPYERPPLTKDYLRGDSERATIYVHPEGYYADNDIELRLEAEVTAIDPKARSVTLANGERIEYDRLLLTTGSEPRRLSIDGAHLDGVNYLRTVVDCDLLRERLDAGGKAVVIGGGWIGAEFAASARQRGTDVTIVEPLSVPLERVLGTELGSFYRDVHASHGVEWMLGTGVAAFEGNGAVSRVKTSDGRLIECDYVVVGIGVVPRVGLAEAAGLGIDNGIVCDQSLKSSDDAIYAAGDVANVWCAFYNETVRVEHWANALNQGPAAARGMLGQGEVYDRLPYFFSDQYDVGMEYSGLAHAHDEVVFRGNPRDGEFVAFWIRDGRVDAGMNVNVWDVNMHVQALIRSRAQVDLARLTDPETPLEQLVAEHSPQAS